MPCDQLGEVTEVLATAFQQDFNLYNELSKLSEQQEKVTANQLCQLVRYLPKSDPKKQNAILSEGLQNACSSIVKLAKQRTQTVDQEKIKKFINDKLSKDQTLKNVYEKVVKLAEEFEGKKDSFYKKNDYQVLIAASLLHHRGKRTVL